MANEIKNEQNEYFGNYDSDLENMFKKLLETTGTEKSLELLKSFSDEVKKSRKKRINEIEKFWIYLNQVKENNEEIRNSKEYKEKMKDNPMGLGRDWWNNTLRIAQELGIQELCQYDDIKNIEDLFFAYVCSIYGHDLKKYDDGSVVIIKDTTIYPNYGCHDRGEVTTGDIGMYVAGTKLCQCNLCKRTFDISNRPLDFDDYTTKVKKSLNTHPKTLLKEKKKLVEYKKITII